ncbi:heterokaryon incompatibility protein-domain-containing protein [Pestalotiopsis sp. NC0098]|nr:heterokaryon incompatibility protein-domain-containing protein [Pestalotiopsis sp. NC0098]
MDSEIESRTSSSEASLPLDQIATSEIEDLIGSWPRRLLHVQSMQSFPWQPGNIYGDAKEPRYNALSYTWGRWALKDHENLEVTGIDVQNVPWTIPRVDPTHFSKSEFQNVLLTIAQCLGTDIDEQGHTVEAESPPVDFVWVDVACIDQRFNQESYLEIGRQADIFRGASLVYIWLTGTTSDNLNEATFDIREFASEARRNMPHQHEHSTIHPFAREPDFEPVWLSYGFKSLKWLQALYKDPWFSSLWTLQEAFLRKDSRFLSKDGSFASPMHRIDEVSYHGSRDSPAPQEDLRTLCLAELVNLCQEIRPSVEANLAVRGIKGLVDDPMGLDTALLLDFFDVSGLTALSRDNPMALYAAAVNRNPSNTLDCIYGIMQVFNFRLGQSNPSVGMDVELTLPDLEDELGIALMSLSPVWSQSFKHVDERRKRGKDWRITRKAAFPEPAYSDCMPWAPERYVDTCKLDVELLNDTIWGRFQGSMCPFPAIREAWSYINDSDTYRQTRWLEGNSDMALVLDVNPELFPETREVGEYSIRRGPMQYMVAGNLANRFGEDLQVLHLGYHKPSLDKCHHFGLILLREGADDEYVWRRLGVCTWDIYPQKPNPVQSTASRPQKAGWVPFYLEPCPVIYCDEDIDEMQLHWATLSMESETWQKTTGIFG